MRTIQSRSTVPSPEALVYCVFRFNGVKYSETYLHIIYIFFGVTYPIHWLKQSLCSQLVDTLREINERHQQVKELEKSLLELHQMFLDMAVLIEQQGVHLDNIENQVRVSEVFFSFFLRYFDPENLFF